MRCNYSSIGSSGHEGILIALRRITTVENISPRNWLGEEDGQCSCSVWLLEERWGGEMASVPPVYT